jgi:diguanylate cyclase (GGDEF)-like protein/PAS domain S-box-containing protein
LFVEHAPAAIAMLDYEMRFLAVSRRWLSDFELSLEEIRGRTYYEAFPRTTERWRDIHRRCLAGNVERNDKDQIERADGELDWVRWEARPWGSDAEDVGGIILFSEVITERVEADEKVRRLNRVYAVLSEINSLIVRIRDSQALFDEACRIAVEFGDFGVAWVGLYHRDTDKVVAVAATGLGLKHPLLAGAAGSLASRSIASGNPEFVNDMTLEIFESKHVNETNREIVELGYRSMIALPLIVDDFAAGAITLWAASENVFDADELKLLREIASDIAFALQYITKREELDYISYYDVLTGLPNRALFLDRVGQEVRSRGRDERSFAVIIMDIERFRNVNDTLGRHGGDELLRALAKRLATSQADDTTLARVGPNTFAAIVEGADDPTVVAHRIEQMLVSSCKAPFTVLGTEIRIAAKVGAALFPTDGKNADELFRNAEASLKRAKETGQRYLFYSVEMNARTARKLTLETRLRKAIEAEEFTLFYQPKVRLDNSELCGLEALIRWNDPERGLIAPGEFIPILEETGLIVEVGRWAIRHAIGDYRDWVSAGHRVPRVAVNVSPSQLQREGFVAEILDLLQLPGADPEALELEITESLIMQNIENSNRALSVLRGAGIHVAMDDFGTGYSSLRYLASLPVDKIKIDRSFVAGMTESALDGKVVSTIISLAHSFGLPVVAEGVETVEQAKVLHALDCDEAQGFLFSPPLPASEIVDLFRPTDSKAP